MLNKILLFLRQKINQKRSTLSKSRKHYVGYGIQMSGVVRLNNTNHFHKKFHLFQLYPKLFIRCCPYHLISD